MSVLSPYLTPVLLLTGSNIFMTTAWYWHLRYKGVSLVYVILISWGLAFIEYCLAVPANRYGNAVYTAAQLKTLQEAVTFAVFAAFSYFYLREPITLTQGFGFALIAAGAFFVFHKW
jgi:uncharacterized protein (DUF486 family)